MKILKGYGICTFLLLLIPVIVTAQTSTPAKTEKLFLNIHLNANRINPENADATGGGGLGIKAGYGFSRLFTLYLGIDGATMNDGNFADDGIDQSEEFGLGFVELGGQFNFRTAKPAAIPYVDAALTAQAAMFDPDQGSIVTFRGGGFSLGGGLKYFVSTTLALDLGLSFSFTNFDEVEVGDVRTDIDQNATSTRLNFGLSWFPFNN